MSAQTQDSGTPGYGSLSGIRREVSPEEAKVLLEALDRGYGRKGEFYTEVEKRERNSFLEEFFNAIGGLLSSEVEPVFELQQRLDETEEPVRVEGDYSFDPEESVHDYDLELEIRDEVYSVQGRTRSDIGWMMLSGSEWDDLLES